jgi:hypothetical protein
MAPRFRSKPKPTNVRNGLILRVHITSPGVDGGVPDVLMSLVRDEASDAEAWSGVAPSASK